MWLVGLFVHGLPRNRRSAASSYLPTRRPRPSIQAMSPDCRATYEAVWRRVQVSGKRKHIAFEWDQAESKFHSLDSDGNGMLDFGELLSILFPEATEHEARSTPRLEVSSNSCNTSMR